MPVKMSDLVDGSTNSTSNNDTSSAGSSSKDELRELCEELGGDFDHAMLYVDQNGQKDELIRYAKWWRDASDEDRELLCQYRAASGENRIRHGWLHDFEAEHDASVSVWSQSFYGDSDAPADGTYNDLQQQVRADDFGGNLMFHQAIFPTPQEAYWPSGEAVLWHEYPDDKIGYGDDKRDTHVFVDRQFIEEYRDYTFTADGETKVRPPTNAEINERAIGESQDGGASVDRALPFNPSDFTVDELRDELDPVTDFTVEGLESVLEEEKRGNGRFNNRKNAKRAIRGALNELRDKQSSDGSDDDGQQSLDEAAPASSDDESASEASESETPGNVAGRIFAEYRPDTKPDVIEGMLRQGMSEEEVVEVVTE
jgi:hypothetical protein